MSGCHEDAAPSAFLQPSDGRLPRVAIAGNPNTGKTTLFNRLTGLNAQVGNYPGVTVDRRLGDATLGGVACQVMDIPGCYSLSARSAEEELAITALMGLGGEAAPDLVLVTVDVTQLERNLYLVMQLLELRRPMVILLNMMDEAQRAGLVVSPARLEQALGVPVLAISAHTGEGLPELLGRLGPVLKGEAPLPFPPDVWPWTPSAELERAIGEVLPQLPPLPGGDQSGPRRAMALWALLSVDEGDELAHVEPRLRQATLAAQQGARARGVDLDALAIQGRYTWIDGHIGQVLSRPAPSPTWTDRLDAVLTHPALGFGIFLALMFTVFWSLFAWADPAISAVEGVFGWIGDGVRGLMGPGLVSDFLVDGVIGGVGSVLVFLPQILLLFFFIAVLEGSGYMARAAFLMDRIMNKIGLHGRAFVPLISGFACAIPAVMATRTMERRRDRFLTMMAVPLMSCSARLPVYTLVLAALFPPEMKVGPLSAASLLLVGMYLFSTVMALVAAAVIGRTVLKGQRVPLLLELPPYRLPDVRSVLRLMYERSRVFVTEAGTVILGCTLVLWALLSFPREDMRLFVPEAPAGVAQVEVDPAQEEAEAAQALASSFGGRLGQLIEPVIAPLGFDWKIGVGIIGAFAAREVFVSTLGVVYGVADADESSEGLREKIRAERRPDGSPRYTPLVGLSLMVFFALACQCMSTLAVIKRETRSWRWPAFVFAYMSLLAYTLSLLVYQGGRLLGLS